MPQHYDETFKKQIVRLRLEEGRTIKSIIEDYRAQKQRVLKEITTIYHEHNGVDGYRSMQIFLKRKHIYLSAPTRLSKNSPMSGTTMCGHIHITATRLHSKLEQELAIIKP